MRISSAYIYRSGLEAMQAGHSQVNHTSLQLATGQQILTAADDPAGATQAAQLNTTIQATEQYQRNGDIVTPWLEQTEWLLSAVTDQLQRVRELVVQGNNDSQTNETRQYIATEIREIRDALFDTVNTKDPNGEYIFAGTQSTIRPFQLNSDGSVSYVGANGVGAVRQVAISPTTMVAIGNSGDDAFMNILENDGHIGAELVRGATVPVSDLALETATVTDLDTFLIDTNATDDFRIEFEQTGTDPLTNERIMQYRVVNTTQDEAEVVEWTDFHSETPITFAGRQVILSGTPQIDDTVTIHPARNAPLFNTLETIAAALERGANDMTGRADLQTASNHALDNLDAGLEHLNMIRATVGTRLQTLETQTSMNAERLIDLKSAQSAIKDLDYSEAISRFTLEQTVLEAAQQSYVQVNKLSLFNFL